MAALEGAEGFDGARVRPGVRPHVVGLVTEDCEERINTDSQKRCVEIAESRRDVCTRTSLSLDPRDDDPSMLLRLLAGAGRFVQLEGAVALNGVALCRLDESNADGGPVCRGVLGGTLGGRLRIRDVPTEFWLDDRDAELPRANGVRPRSLWNVTSSLSPSSLASCGESSGLSLEYCGDGGCSDDWFLAGDSRGLFFVRSAMNWRRTCGVTSMPGLLARSARSISISESVRRSTSL